jgi:hypothetical protein
VLWLQVLFSGATHSYRWCLCTSDVPNVDADAVKYDASQNEESDESSRNPFQGGHILILLRQMFAHVEPTGKVGTSFFLTGR